MQIPMKNQKKGGHILFLILLSVFLFLPSKIFAASVEGRLRIDRVLSAHPLQTISIASSSQKISTDEFFYSPILPLKFLTTAIGFSWLSSTPTSTEMKFLENETWSTWIPVEQGEIPSQTQPEKKFSNLIFSNHAEKIIVRSTDKKFLQQIEIIYIDANDPSLTLPLKRGGKGGVLSIASSNPSSLRVISRAEWGADESYRFRKISDLPAETVTELTQKNAEVRGDEIEIWPQEYANVKKFVMHETDGYNGGDDPSATVRGVYHWHAKTLGWGDIGYHYLVDSLGNIYEGRAGGDGVIGGHVYHTQTVTNPDGAKVSVGFNMNVGSMGISMLGSYKKDTATGPAQIAVARLITQKALDFQIDPLGNDVWPVTVVKISKEISDQAFLEALPNSTKLFQIKNIPTSWDLSSVSSPKIILSNVINFTGHKDIDYKLDPQENLVGVFTNSRTLASQDFEARMKNGVRFAATILSQSSTEIRLNKDQSQLFTVSVRNDGETTWHGYTEKNILLADNNIVSRLSSIHASNLVSVMSASNTLLESFPFTEKNVAPGEIATFSWTITPPQNKAKERREYILALNSVGYFDEARVAFDVVNLDLAMADYAAEFSSHNFPPAFLDNAKPKLLLTYKNVGKLPWKKGELLLNIIEIKNETRPSPWKDKTWKTDFAQTTFREEEVAPEGSATFEIPFANLSPGIFRHRFYITREVKQNSVLLGDEKVIGSDTEIETRIDARYAAVVSHTIPAVIKTSWRPKISFTIKNSGLLPWKDVLKIVNLYKPKDIKLSFVDNSWKNQDIIAQKSVNLKPGESVTFEFKIDAPKKPGIYDFKYKLLIGKQEIFINSRKEQIIKVRVD